jgi:hypothetical protein
MDLSFLPDQKDDDEIFKEVTKVTRRYSLDDFFKMIEDKHDYAFPMYDEYKEGRQWED